MVSTQINARRVILTESFESYTFTICNDVNLWATIFLLLHEDSLYGIALCYRVSVISFGANIYGIHIWTRNKPVGIRRHSSVDKYVSQQIPPLD